MKDNIRDALTVTLGFLWMAAWITGLVFAAIHEPVVRMGS